MIRVLARAVPAALLGALAGSAWLVLWHWADPAVRTDLADSPPRLISGLYPAERVHDSGLTFAWTGELMTARFPGLDRRVDWQLDLRARGARADPSTNPDVTVFADGVPLVTAPSTSDFATLRVRIPARPDRRGVTIALRVSATVVPGAHDPRHLGVMIDAMSLSPDGIALPSSGALFGAAAATAPAAVAAALAGGGSLAIAATAIVAGAATSAPLARGFGPYTDYPYVLAWLSIGVWAAVVLLRAGTGLTRRAAGPESAAPLVLIVSAMIVIMKLAVLYHPGMPVGDALFHAHRFHEVLAGRLYFTSVAPGNYSFPYAPGLYVIAAPFAELVQRGAADMFLLRTIVIVADAAAAVLLYFAVVRAGAGRAAGMFTLVLYHIIPLEYRIATVGNLTNAFSQSLAAVAFAIAMAPVVRRSTGTAAVLTFALAAAFLSHTSTFAIASVGALVIAAVLYARGGRELRPVALATAAGAIGAAAVAVLIYYAHFLDVYKSEWARISVETATAAPDAGGRSIVERLAAVPRNLHLHLGIPALALAAWGAASLRATAGARLALTVGGWTLACAAFLVIGVLTPVDMRHYLAVIPALAVAGGVAVAGGYASGGAQRLIALGLLGWAVAIFLHTWWHTLP